MSAQNEGFHDEVESMVERALKKLEKPYGPDVIEDVFVAIEQHPNLLRDYQQFWVNNHQRTVNQRVGHFTRVLTGYGTAKSVKATRTGLTQTYTVLIPSASANPHCGVS